MHVMEKVRTVMPVFDDSFTLNSSLVWKMLHSLDQRGPTYSHRSSMTLKSHTSASLCIEGWVYEMRMEWRENWENEFFSLLWCKLTRMT